MSISIWELNIKKELNAKAIKIKSIKEPIITIKNAFEIFCKDRKSYEEKLYEANSELSWLKEENDDLRRKIKNLEKEKEADLKELEEKGFVDKDGYFLVRNDVLNGFVSAYNENEARKEYGGSRISTTQIRLPDGCVFSYDNTMKGYMEYQRDLALRTNR